MLGDETERGGAAQAIAGALICRGFQYTAPDHSQPEAKPLCWSGSVDVRTSGQHMLLHFCLY